METTHIHHLETHQQILKQHIQHSRLEVKSFAQQAALLKKTGISLRQNARIYGDIFSLYGTEKTLVILFSIYACQTETTTLLYVHTCAANIAFMNER